MKHFIPFLLVIAFISCTTNSSSSIDISLLLNEWVHLYEEDADSVQTYRPADYMEFPPSRYRQRYIFEESGNAEWLVLSPTDAHYFESGKWLYDETENHLIITDSTDTHLKRFKIISLEPDLLEMVPRSFD